MGGGNIMGSGSFGGGGGGGFYSGGSGGWPGTAPGGGPGTTPGGGPGQGGNRGEHGIGFLSKNGKMLPVKKTKSEIEGRVEYILKKQLNKNYIMGIFCSLLLHEIYKALFKLHNHLFSKKSWEGIEKEYKIPGNKGCLMRWVDSLFKKLEKSEPNQKFREIIRDCITDFFAVALEGGINAYLDADAKSILAQAKKEIFDKIPWHFLEIMLWKILERENEIMPSETITEIKKVSKSRTEKIIASFESTFETKEKVKYPELFYYICKNEEWFLKELRK
jgi:hypothetical protein